MNAPVQSLRGLDLKTEIDRLRKERNAVILAHYYQTPDIQDIADFVGDSLDLSAKAAATDADVIAFCGVRFMAEVAKILSPQKTVILPDMDAGCSLEDQLPARTIRPVPRRAPRSYRADLHQLLGGGEGAQRHHRHLVVGREDPRAAADGPEDHLRAGQESGRLVQPQDRPRHAAVAGRVHRPRGVLGDRAAQAQGAISGCAGRGASRMPGVHPRSCRRGRLDARDPRLRAASPAQTIIVATEPHIIHQMEKAAPHKTFIGAPGADGNCNCNMCPYMAMNTMEKLYVALRDMEPRIELDEATRLAAKKPLDRMLEMAGRTVGQGDVGRPG